MTDKVTDAGLVKAFLPMKPGAFTPTDAKPSCANCPCSTKNAVGGDGKLVCTRFPPELNLLTVYSQMGPPKQLPNVGFKPVHPDMVCWEHPAMQVRMERAIVAAHGRDRSAAPAHDVVSIGTMTGEQKAHCDQLLAESFQQTAEAASVQEADGRKPGDEP